MDKNKKQIRIVELRNLNIPEADNEMILEGYAAVYDSPTVIYEIDGIEYKEVIERGAFEGAIMKDCCLKYNHGDNAFVMARVRGGSLILTPDSMGLHFKAKLFNTQSARDVYTLVKEGGIDKCSFGFIVLKDSYNVDTRTRSIKKFKEIYDVSVVDIPAYDNTNVEARSYFELERSKENTLEREKLVNELVVRTYL